MKCSLNKEQTRDINHGAVTLQPTLKSRAKIDVKKYTKLLTNFMNSSHRRITTAVSVQAQCHLDCLA